MKLGYTGSDGRVAAFARVWRAARQKAYQTTGRGTFVPRVFQSGEAFRFDWNEDFAILGGVRTKLQVAHHLADAEERGFQELLVDQQHEVEVHRRLVLRRAVER